jgi:EAL and modified HD-GYP domain-containing signal transduction protein
MEPSEPVFLQDIFVGRQPIYSRRLELYAYELLYRGADMDFADFEEGDRATSQVLLNTFTEFGIERVVGGHLAFVNLTRGFIIGEYPLPVPRTQVVLEVLEDVEPDEEVLAGLRDLRQRGFRIALDDFVYEERFKPMLELADIIKLDVLNMSDEEIVENFERLKPYGAKMLAEKIETRAQFDLCFEIGFDYFQGYFLAKPNVVMGSAVVPSRMNLLRLLSEIQSPACDFERVQEIVTQDVTLSFKLLRHINAVIYGMPRRIESIKETVVYLGLDAVKNIACLSLLSDMDDTPHELIVTSMLRGRMCQNLAKASGTSELEPFFTVGLFSILDAMMNSSMRKIISQLPLTEELQAALVSHEGPCGQALASTLAYEIGDWQNVDCFGLSRRQIKEAFLEAVAWVDKIDGEMFGMAA